MISVLLITHDRLGAYLIDTLSGMLGQLSLPTETLEIHRTDDPDAHVQRATGAIARMDTGDGVLIITDVFGSTPSNIANLAHARAREARSRVITGLNLPMLIRIYNYPSLALDTAADSAIVAGRNGIIACTDITH